MSALVEEAVTVGDLVRLFTFRQGNANLVELTLPTDSPYVGKPTGLIPLPDNCALVTILRDGQVYVPDPEQPVESGDELLFVIPEDLEDELESAPRPPSTARRTDGACRSQSTVTRQFCMPAPEGPAPYRSSRVTGTWRPSRVTPTRRDTKPRRQTVSANAIGESDGVVTASALARSAWCSGPAAR